MDTFERVRKIVANLLTVSEAQVTLDSSLANDLGADSLALVEVSMAIEEEFDIKLEDEEAFALETVRQIVDCIAAKTGTGTEAPIEAAAGASR